MQTDLVATYMVGTCTEAGTDENGTPRVVVETSREQLAKLRGNIVFKEVQVGLKMDAVGGIAVVEELGGVVVEDDREKETITVKVSDWGSFRKAIERLGQRVRLVFLMPD